MVLKLSDVEYKSSFDHAEVSWYLTCRISLGGCMEELMWHWISGQFFGWVILLGSFFEKQVFKVDMEKEIMITYIQNGPENDEKVTPGRPKSRPWSGHGSDALSGAFFNGWRRWFFLTFRSLFEDFFGPLFDDFSDTSFLMKQIDLLKTSVSPRREHHFWRSGADLESLGSDHNRPKVLPESPKKGIYEKNRKAKKNIQTYKTGTLTKCRI